MTDRRREPHHERRLRSNPRLSREAAVGWAQANKPEAVEETRRELVKRGKVVLLRGVR